ncbi:MAG TPA: VanW family protein [bacterium]|nr:VanW family protein [bacterium]HPV65617.1 VanW family protein [bacterium]
MSLKFKKAIFLVCDVLLFLVIFLLIFYLFFESKFDNKIYPNVYLNGFNLGGLSTDDAKKIVEKEIEEFDAQGVRIIAETEEVLWRRDVFSFDPDLVSQTVFFDIEKTMDDAFLLGRSGNIFSDFYFKTSSLFVKRSIPLSFLLDKEKIKKYLYDSFDQSISLAKNADIISNKSSDFNDFLQTENVGESNGTASSSIVFIITPEVYGKQINYDKFFVDFENNLAYLKNDNIGLDFIEGEPEIKIVDANGSKEEAYSLLNLAPFNLIYKNDKEEKIFTISKEDFSTWLKLSRKNDVSNNGLGVDKIVVDLDSEKFFSFLKEKISPEIEREPTKPQFEFKDDKVSFFSPGSDGLKINQEKTFDNVLNSFVMKDFSQVLLSVEISKTDDVGNTNDMGIKELIGSGHSNFAGSPTNRRHNIKVGAEKLNGLIIKPGEEFSLVTALGPTTAEAGYLPELVIKGNKTVPEYGGGLCQVATTMFRAALGTGLPITERKNHSYRVSYYEPAGTDATIYSPRPDLKFKNDTNHNILIQARFEGANDMYFDFWGTSDGRLSTTTYPVIYNIVRPGPTQIIETTDLKPGEKKCTERAHSGAEAYFDYFVTYNPGTESENKVENRFYSKYVPWREVCLVGVEAKAEVVEDAENSADTESPEVLKN